MCNHVTIMWSPPTEFACHDGGATSLGYSLMRQRLFCGGKKGEVCVFDIRQSSLLHSIPAHTSSINCIAVNDVDGYFVTGASDGDIKVRRRRREEGGGGRWCHHLGKGSWPGPALPLGVVLLKIANRHSITQVSFYRGPWSSKILFLFLPSPDHRFLYSYWISIFPRTTCQGPPLPSRGRGRDWSGYHAWGQTVFMRCWWDNQMSNIETVIKHLQWDCVRVIDN